MLPSEAPTQRPVIIIDDAELLRDDALECLHLLSGVTIGRMPQIVFIGNSTFWDRVDLAAEADLRAGLSSGGSCAAGQRAGRPRGSLPQSRGRSLLHRRRRSRAGRRSRLLMATACAATVAGVIGGPSAWGPSRRCGIGGGSPASVDARCGGGSIGYRTPDDAGRLRRAQTEPSGRADHRRGGLCGRRMIPSLLCGTTRRGGPRPLMRFRRGEAAPAAAEASPAAAIRSARTGAACPADRAVARRGGATCDRDGRAGQRSGTCFDGCQPAR